MQLRTRHVTQFDVKQSIGKRYARMDEAGTPWCFTVDQDTLSDGTVVELCAGGAARPVTFAQRLRYCELAASARLHESRRQSHRALVQCSLLNLAELNALAAQLHLEVDAAHVNDRSDRRPPCQIARLVKHAVAIWVDELLGC